MPAITLSRLTWSAPDGTAVLSDIDFTFGPKRIGLIGRNGVGKSTLLNLVTGALVPTGGSVAIDGTMALLRQEVEGAPDAMLADLFDARDALALLDKAAAGHASMDDLEQCDWTLPDRIADTLSQVGLEGAVATPLATLSGGQRTRAGLAAALFARPDFLLLDEPTNHLDSDGRAMLIALLGCWQGGAIVVSHDRALLDTMDAIVELTPSGLTSYGGNWSAYRIAKDVELAAAQHDFSHATRQAANLARSTQIARERQQRRDGAGKRDGARGGTPRILLGQRKAQAQQSSGDAARRAEQQQAQMRDAIATARDKIEIWEPLRVILPSAHVASDRVLLSLEAVRAGHDPARPALRGVSLHVRGPERIAITGPNGAGKSTLLHLIAGHLEPIAGRIQRPVACALLDQDASLLDPDVSIADNFAQAHPGATRNAVHAALARFGFRADLSLQRVGTLSGGQKLRAALACVLGGDRLPPLLLLDEPTNHLDLDSIAAIEQGIAAYDGALIVVSHDAAFLNAIGITRTVAIAP